jgi:predicted porin
MKKILAGTTALVAVGALASAAQAAEPIKLSVGGLMNQWVTFGDVDSYTYATGRVRSYGNVGIISDTEVHFKGDTTLDNGLKVAVTIQLEAERSDSSTARNASEQYVTLSGGWGQVRVGEMKNAATIVHNQAPTAGAAFSDITSIFPNSVPNGASLQTLTNNTTSVDGIADAGACSTAIDYISPMFGPFAFGVTYTPKIGGRGFAQENRDLKDLIGGALVYADKWGPVGINADVAYARFDYDMNQIAATGGAYSDNATGVVHGVPLGLKISYAGFEVGGSYFRIMDSLKVGQGATGNGAAGSYDGAAWDAGVSYTTGPWRFAYAYYKSSLAGDIQTNKSKDTQEMHNLGGAYTMGPGVTASANFAYNKYVDEAGSTVGNKQESMGFIAGLQLAF